MTNRPKNESPGNNVTSHLHSEAVPPDVLAARVATLLRPELAAHITETVRRLNELLLAEHASMKPLLSVTDLAKTRKVSSRIVETIIATGKIKPLWIEGQRRFHPDTVDAYLRNCEKPRRRPPRRGSS